MLVRHAVARSSAPAQAMATARDLQAQLAQARSPEEYVDMLQHGTSNFPRVALFWRLYAEHERATKGPEAAWKLLEENSETALSWCRCDADLWRVAAECCRDAHPREERASEGTARVGRTFEKAVAAAGAAPEATALWRAYRDWAANSAPVAQRAEAKASLLRRAALIPGEGNDEFWREIEKEAREGGDETQRDQAAALEALAQAARRDGAARLQIWRAARHAQTEDDLGRWRIVIAYERASMPTEKRRTEATDAEKAARALSIDAGRRRIAAAYRAAIDACDSNAPELFLELADWAEACHAEDEERPVAIPGGADTEGAGEDEALIASPFSLEDESPLFQAAPVGADAAVGILESAAKTCSTSVLAAAAHAAALERLGRPAEAEACLEALVSKELKTDDPEAKEGELCAAPWVLLERHCRRHRGKEAARDIFQRSADLRREKKIDARIYEGHAVIEARANSDKLAARRVFELGLDQRPELLQRHDAVYVLTFAHFLETDCSDADAASAVIERSIASYKTAEVVPHVLWDALVSVYHRHASSRDAAAKARAVEVRRKQAGAGGVGGALMSLWRDVSSAGILPLNATDTAWRFREAIPATLVRDLASCRDHAAKLEAARADGLLADEVDNGGLDASDLDAGDGGDAVALLLAAGTLPPNLRRLTDRIHTKARKQISDPRAVQFVLDALLRAPLPPPPTKKRGRDDDHSEDDEAPPDAFRARRAAKRAAK